MKKILLSILMLATLGVYAQEENLLVKRATSLSRDYLRPSMSRIIVHDGSSAAKKATDILVAIEDNKFDVNELEDNVYSLTRADKETDFKLAAEEILSDDKVGNQIMKNWFPHFIAGNGYDTDVLLQRGEFAATDNDVLKQNASQRKSVLNELGEKLIDRSYCMIVFVADSSYTDKNGDYFERVCLRPYLYKLDFNEEVRNDFYINHYTTEGGINAMNFPMKYVTNLEYKYAILDIKKKNGDNANGVTLNIGLGSFKAASKTDDAGYEAIMRDFTKVVADFQVKVPIVSTNPIAVKIGTKENLKMDRRFSVMEYTQKSDGTEVAKRVATVRSNKVADNNTVATGHTENLSEFYCVKGLGIKEGMVLVESPDLGVIVDVKYGLSGFDASVGYRISRFLSTKPSGLFLYFNFGVVGSDQGGMLKLLGYNHDKDDNGKDLSTGSWEEVNAVKLSGGISKEFNFAKSFVLTPALEFGFWVPLCDKIIIENNTAKPVSDDSKEGSNGSGFTMSGIVQLGYMVTRNIQLYGETGFNIFTLDDAYKYMRDAYARENKTEAADPRKIRLGIGTRIYF